MTDKALATVHERARAILVSWYDEQRPAPQLDAERYVVCAGLAVLERLKTAYPLQ